MKTIAYLFAAIFFLNIFSLYYIFERFDKVDRQMENDYECLKASLAVINYQVNEIDNIKFEQIHKSQELLFRVLYSQNQKIEQK